MFDELGTDEGKFNLQYTRKVLQEMHEAFVKIYGTDIVDDSFGFLAVPGIVESEKTGDVYPALLSIDFASSGEHWRTMIITSEGAKEQDNDELPEDNEFFEENVCPYHYWYTLRCDGDIHTSLDDCPSDIKDILFDCNENLFNENGGMSLS